MLKRRAHTGVTNHQLRLLNGPITDLFVRRLECDSTVNPILFDISSQAVSLTLTKCILPSNLMNRLLEQVSRSCTLLTINLWDPSLRDIITLTLSNKMSLTRLDLGYMHMPAELCENVCKQLRYLVHLEFLDLCSNHNISAYSHYLTEAIKAWGPDSPLMELSLFQCGDVCNSSLLSALSLNCRQLTHLDLSEDTVMTDNIMSDSHPGEI